MLECIRTFLRRPEIHCMMYLRSKDSLPSQDTLTPAGTLSRVPHVDLLDPLQLREEVELRAEVLHRGEARLQGTLLGTSALPSNGGLGWVFREGLRCYVCVWCFGRCLAFLCSGLGV